HHRAARGIGRRRRGPQEGVAEGQRRICAPTSAHRDRRPSAPPHGALGDSETSRDPRVGRAAFDSDKRRQTSFASVFVYPEVDESIEIEINPADLRIDTYRAARAGGQHVNKTESAVRTPHLPTNIVVSSQNDRSQHRNRAEAFSMLKAKLYELELRKQTEQKQKLEDSKTDIGWGHQIRSYVLDQSRIKDLRNNHEVGDTQRVLDGDLEDFIAASLKQGV